MKGIDLLVEKGSISNDGAEVLKTILKYRPNILLLGMSGSGKTFTVKRILEEYGNCNLGIVRGYKEEFQDVNANCNLFKLDSFDEVAKSSLKIDVLFSEAYGIDFNKLKGVKGQLLFESQNVTIDRIIHYLGKRVFKVLILVKDRRLDNSGGFNDGVNHVIKSIKVFHPDVGLYLPVYRYSDNYVNRDLVGKVFEFKPKRVIDNHKS